MSKVRRGGRWALGVGAALIAMAAVGDARADVRFVDLDECSAHCLPSAAADAAVAEDEAGHVTLSRSGAGRTEDASDARPDLILDPAALPPVLVSGLPSPNASAGARALDGPGVSPYAFFDEVIDVPISVDSGNGIAAAALFLFAPSLIGRLTLTDVLSNSSDLFKPTTFTLPHPAM